MKYFLSLLIFLTACAQPDVPSDKINEIENEEIYYEGFTGNCKNGPDLVFFGNYDNINLRLHDYCLRIFPSWCSESLDQSSMYNIIYDSNRHREVDISECDIVFPGGLKPVQYYELYKKALGKVKTRNVRLTGE